MVDLSRILSISASDWAKTQGKDLSKYKAQGVHFGGCSNSFNWIHEKLLNLYAGTEVIVNYNLIAVPGERTQAYTAYGTALIPKQKEVLSKKENSKVSGSRL